MEDRTRFIFSFIYFKKAIVRAQKEKGKYPFWEEEETNIHSRYLALTYYGLGRYYYKIHLYSRAKSWLTKADNIFRVSELHMDKLYYGENIFNIISLLCFTEIKLGHTENAKKYFNILIERLQLNGDQHPQRKNKYITLMTIAKKIDDYNAMKYWEKKISEIDNKT